MGLERGEEKEDGGREGGRERGEKRWSSLDQLQGVDYAISSQMTMYTQKDVLGDTKIQNIDLKLTA